MGCDHRSGSGGYGYLFSQGEIFKVDRCESASSGEFFYCVVIDDTTILRVGFACDIDLFG
jgi:hypothetical protein